MKGGKEQKPRRMVASGPNCGGGARTEQNGNQRPKSGTAGVKSLCHLGKGRANVKCVNCVNGGCAGGGRNRAEW